MVMNRRSFMDLLAKGGCSLAVLASGVTRVARDVVFRRAQTDSDFPGRRKNLLPDDVAKPSHWLG